MVRPALQQHAVSKDTPLQNHVDELGVTSLPRAALLNAYQVASREGGRLYAICHINMSVCGRAE